jgi:hypothetical protein
MLRSARVWLDIDMRTNSMLAWIRDFAGASLLSGSKTFVKEIVLLNALFWQEILTVVAQEFMRVARSSML